MLGVIGWLHCYKHSVERENFFFVHLTQDRKKKEGQDDCLERRQSKGKEKEYGIGGS